MKRVSCCFLTVLLLIGIFPVCGNAAEIETIHFEDGSYATIEITSNEVRASGSKTGSKSYTYYNSDSVRQWKATLTGSFTYTGSSATCTSSDINVTIYDSDCYVISQNAGKSGNTARGSVTMGLTLLGGTVEKTSASLTLKCDANGNLS